MQPCYSCSWVRRATLNPEKRGTPGRRGSMYTAFFSLQPMFSPAMMALMRLSICPRLFLICWSSGKPPVPMSSKKALLRDASAFVVMPAVPIWWNVQYSANENGKRRISLYLPIRCVASSLLRSLALLPLLISLIGVSFYKLLISEFVLPNKSNWNIYESAQK